VNVRPLKLLSVAEATALYHSKLAAADPAVETVRLTEAIGRVLAETVRAADDVPGFDRSTVDGYAVRAADTFGASEPLPALLTVAGDVRMGVPAGPDLASGRAVRIPTGGMLPGGADAVVMVEYAEELDASTVAVQRPVAPGENVLVRGEDMTAGALVLDRGRRLRASDIGALAGIGRTEVAVFRRPRVAVISSGDEIVPPDRAPGPGEVRDINAYGLAALATQTGAVASIAGIVRDDFDELLRVAREALAADAVVISGGSSVGTRDATARVIDALGPPGVLVHGVAVKPGKPTILGLAAGSPPRPIFGLPGHPASAMVIFELFVRPVLRRLAGLQEQSVFSEQGPVAPSIRARLAENVPSSPAREDYVRVRLVVRDDGLWAVPVPGKSGLITTLVQADGLVCVPLGRQGYEAGEEVSVRPLT
jgi:molybdopterin molybdotransferase